MDDVSAIMYLLALPGLEPGIELYSKYGVGELGVVVPHPPPASTEHVSFVSPQVTPVLP